jgi:hypothetical protein
LKVTSERKIRANRANARASTGPKTLQGGTRSARNALRHALSLPVYSDPVFSEAVEALTREIAGAETDGEMLGLARRIAEAQIDLRRVRDARYELLCRELSNIYYDSRSNVREKVAMMSRLLRPNAPEMPLAVLVKYLTMTPEGPDKLALILSQELQRLSAMDRYERRALSRRRFAIRAFDLATRGKRAFL